MCGARVCRNRLMQVIFCWLLGLQLAVAADEQGLLFKFQRKGEPPSYLFGTIHSEDPRVLDLPDPVEDALARSTTLVLEIPMESPPATDSSRLMRLPSGQRLSDLIEPGLYRRLREAVSSMGMAESELQQFRPWALALLLSLPAPRTGEFLDLRLSHLAQQQGKRLEALESPDEQLLLFERLPLSDQRILLQQALNNIDMLPTQTLQLVDAWLRRDLGRLQELSLQEVGDLRLDRWFKEQIVDRRNCKMVQRLIPMTARGPLLVAVGALHLPGEQGMLKLLRDAGYRVARRY